MLGDYSSVCYDWLITGKPIILINKNTINMDKDIYDIFNYVPVINSIDDFENKIKEFDYQKANELLHLVFYQPMNKNILFQSIYKIKELINFSTKKRLAEKIKNYNLFFIILPTLFLLPLFIIKILKFKKKLV